MVPSTLMTISQAPYAIYDLVPPPATTVEGRAVPPPPAFAAARPRFQAACAAYAATRYADAARGFLDAARILRASPAAPTLAAARTAAYRNAAHALQLAAGSAAAARVMEPLMAEDPPCAPSIRAALAALPR